MDKQKIPQIIEKFAPLELAESWDCPGWAIETNTTDIRRVMICLTVTDDVVKQAKNQNCDVIVSHHPLFFVPINWRDIDIYCAHTNLDMAQGGTTDTLIDRIFPCCKKASDGFLRYVDCNIEVYDFLKILKEISPNLRFVNNKNVKTLKKIAFCAGSGSEFIEEAYKNGADALVTGDIKFHTALESPIVLFDLGHFESEIQVLKVFENLLKASVEVVYSKEKSPFNIDI